MMREIIFTMSFVKAYEYQEFIMGVGEWTPPPLHEVITNKEMIR